MTAPSGKRPSWRPRWSIRLLLVVVTLLCAYLACWRPTVSRAVRDVSLASSNLDRFTWNEDVIAPLLVRADEIYVGRSDVTPRRGYYFWFFGYVVRLPYEREIDPDVGRLWSLLFAFDQKESAIPESLRKAAIEQIRAGFSEQIEEQFR